MSTSSTVERLIAAAEARGFAKLATTLSALSIEVPRGAAPTWPAALPELLGAATHQRLDGAALGQVIAALPSPDRDIVAVDALHMALLPKDAAATVSSLRERAKAATAWHDLSQRGAPFATDAVVTSKASLQAAATAAAPAPGDNALTFTLGALGALAGADDLAKRIAQAQKEGDDVASFAAAVQLFRPESTVGESVRALTRGELRELHLAKVTTWASALSTVLLRVVGYGPALLDLVEMAGDLPFFAKAEAPLTALATECNAPEPALLYLRGRALRDSADQATIAEWVQTAKRFVEQELGASLSDPARLETLTGARFVWGTDLELGGLLLAAIADRGLLLGEMLVADEVLVSLGKRAPRWRYLHRTLFASLIARGRGRAELAPNVESYFAANLAAFGVDYPSIERFWRYMDPGTPWHTRATTLLLSQLDAQLDSRDAWFAAAHAIATPATRRELLMEVSALMAEQTAE